MSEKTGYYDPVSIRGAFVRLEGAYRWRYDPNIRGEYCFGYHDSMAFDSELGREECEKHEQAFRQGFAKGIRMIMLELEELPEHKISDYGVPDDDEEGRRFVLGSVALEQIRELAATLRQKRDAYRASVEIALKGQYHKRYPCRVMCEIGHWHQAAYLRGMHHAVEFLIQEWEAFIDLNTELLDDDYVMVDTDILRQWWNEVSDWRQGKRLVPPPRPVFPGKQVEMFLEK